ncbi:MAG: hypothetical protein ACOX2O_06260 [Bdellovibrionota bacterium]
MKYFLIYFFAFGVVALGANELLKEIDPVGKNKVTKDEIIPIMHGRLSLDQGRFPEEELKKLQEFRAKNGNDKRVASWFGVDTKEDYKEIK